MNPILTLLLGAATGATLVKLAQKVIVKLMLSERRRNFMSQRRRASNH